MSNKNYILNELKLMRVECERLDMSPMEWIEQNAEKYYTLYATKIRRKTPNIFLKKT